MPRGSDLRVVDPVLTNLARGYTNAEYVGIHLFPIANVTKEAGKIPTFGKESFKIFNTERALRSNSNRLPVEARDKAEYATAEHDAAYPIDYREKDEDLFNLQAYGTYRSVSAVQIKHEKQCADLAITAANFPTGNKLTVSGTDRWTVATSDPIAQVRAAQEAIRKKIAKRPNTLVLSALAFNALQDHSKITDRVKYSQLGVVTADLLKTLFNIPNIFVGDALYVDDDGTAHDMWGDAAVLAYIPQAKSNVARSVYEPSFGYTLRKNGMPEVDTFMEEGGKIQNIRDTDNFQVKLLGADAGYLITGTNAAS